MKALSSDAAAGWLHMSLSKHLLQRGRFPGWMFLLWLFTPSHSLPRAGSVPRCGYNVYAIQCNSSHSYGDEWRASLIEAQYKNKWSIKMLKESESSMRSRLLSES